MIQFSDVTFQYKGNEQKALNQISLTIEDGEFVGIIGTSGAGKSTFTYALNGLVPHHFHGDFYGSVRINGKDTVETSPEELSNFIGEVFQDIDSQMVASVVEDEILFGMENFKVPGEEITRRLEQVLNQLGIQDLRNRQIATLSGGQKQKVAIAAILAIDPAIIVLDEPTGELDPQSSVMIFEILKTLNKTYHKTVIVVEQKIMLLTEFADRLLVMQDGQVLLDGPKHEVMKHTQRFQEIGINVPRVVELAADLQKKQLYQGNYPLNVTEAEQMVREVLADADI